MPRSAGAALAGKGEGTFAMMALFVAIIERMEHVFEGEESSGDENSSGPGRSDLARNFASTRSCGCQAAGDREPASTKPSAWPGTHAKVWLFLCRSTTLAVSLVGTHPLWESAQSCDSTQRQRLNHGDLGPENTKPAWKAGRCPAKPGKSYL
jgi:hypothetical protein